MNPHFIFNSLNSIKLYIIDNEKENAVYYLNKFSKLIRKILAATKEKETTLADEIETMKLYMNIENIRFSNAIKSSFNIDKNLNVNTIKVPSLILQPFIENAIWHGLSSKKGDKKISLTFEENNNKFLIITIEDNGVGRKRSSEIKEKKIHKRDSIGIKLTEDRLENFAQSYKNDFSITFIDLYDSENEPRGTKVILKIPLK
jgi:LytS/YehU family sensor histidine kinase